MYIYKTVNNINGKVYVGKSEKGFNPNYYGSGTLINKAISKYGRNNFVVEIIELCNTVEELNDREVYWIDYYKQLGETYNIAEGGTGGHTTKHFTKEQMNEYRGKLSKAQSGRKVSEETKQKLSDANKGKWHGDTKVTSKSIKDLWNDPNSVYNSDEYRQKLSKSRIGRVFSEETKRKISESRMGGDNPMAIKIKVGDIIYETRRECAKEYNISETAVTKRCKSKSFPDWEIIK